MPESHCPLLTPGGAAGKPFSPHGIRKSEFSKAHTRLSFGEGQISLSWEISNHHFPLVWLLPTTFWAPSQSSAQTPDLSSSSQKNRNKCKMEWRCSYRSIPPQLKEPFGSKYKSPTINSLSLQVCTQGAASCRMWQGQRLICFFLCDQRQKEISERDKAEAFPTHWTGAFLWQK